MSARPPHPSHPILTIDGPAGAGKSTLAARMAARFRLLNIETGAMYRAFALKANTLGISVDDAGALARLSEQTTIELRPDVAGDPSTGPWSAGDRVPGNQVLLDGIDVTAQLRSRTISEAASRVSVHGPVRAWMVRLQQALGVRALPDGVCGIVMEGRDIGTVVFPEAGLKIFLSASPEARTERRLAQEESGAGEMPDKAALLAALEQRDQRDRSRAESPLRAAGDAVAIDSTALSLDEVTAQMEALVQERWQLP